MVLQFILFFLLPENYDVFGEGEGSCRVWCVCLFLIFRTYCQSLLRHDCDSRHCLLVTWF